MIGTSNSPQNLSSLPPAGKKYPTKLFVETTTNCNLGCFMCVKQTGNCSIAEGEMTPETFKALEPVLAHAEALILNGVGEPLLNPELDNFIARARELMPQEGWIGFQSNGLLIDDLRARALLEAGLDKVCISVDAVTPDKLKRLREGAEISGIGKAFDALSKAKFSVGRPDFQIGAEIVIMRDNLQELPTTLKWAAKHGATFALVTHVLPYEENHLSEAVYEPCSAQALEIFTHWKDKAARAGVDISSYPRLVGHYISHNIPRYESGTERQQIIDYVEAMKQDAEAKNIFLDLKKMFNLDTSHLKRVEEVFRQAAEVAADEEIDLQLPELLLKEERRCDFVEEGSLFVSWEGNIHPCYFLWHSYHCYASGWQQMVQPKILGNLNQQPVLDIWNAEEFTAFRKNVLNYDYPYCSSCTLAPCNYIQTEEFEQDCHINQEPCGSCLWCMGLYQCLR